MKKKKHSKDGRSTFYVKRKEKERKSRGGRKRKMKKERREEGRRGVVEGRRKVRGKEKKHHKSQTRHVRVLNEVRESCDLKKIFRRNTQINLIK